MRQSTARFLASLSPTFICNLTPYIKLPAYVRTSCWSARSILMSVQKMQIGRYKANADARSQYYNFVGFFSKYETESFSIKKFRRLI